MGIVETALARVISEVESHPWIASISAACLEYTYEITEQRPVAIYNDTQYLGVSGDLFEPPTQ